MKNHIQSKCRFMNPCSDGYIYKRVWYIRIKAYYRLKDCKSQIFTEFGMHLCLLVKSQDTLRKTYQHDWLKVSWKREVITGMSKCEEERPQDLSELRVGEIVFSRGKYSNCLSNTKYPTVKTYMWITLKHIE